VLLQPRKRLKRYDRPDHARFVTFSCFRNRPFLCDELICRDLADALCRARDRFDCRIWAFVFMPDHVHLLLRSPGPMADVLKSVKQSAAKRAVNRARASGSGHLGLMADASRDGRIVYRLWQRGGGYDRNLWEPKKIREAIDYIHLNPVRAGLTTTPRAWRWSSVRAFEGTGDVGVPIPVDRAEVPWRD
jgi:putative transposase